VWPACRPGRRSSPPWPSELSALAARGCSASWWRLGRALATVDGGRSGSSWRILVTAMAPQVGGLGGCARRRPGGGARRWPGWRREEAAWWLREEAAGVAAWVVGGARERWSPVPEREFAWGKWTACERSVR
jgi:hypothetical protein